MSELQDTVNPETFESLALALPARAPGAGLRDRLMARVSGPDRFLPFLDRVADLFDLSPADAQAHLDTIVDDTSWDELAEGVRFRDFDGGPKLGDAHGGLVRMQPGAVFPEHRHVGDEILFVLQGRLRDDEGNELRAGDRLVSADGTSHRFVALGEREVVYAVVVIAMQFPETDDDDW